MSAPTIAADARVRAIPWRDLLQTTKLERLWELTLPLPWLIGSFWWMFFHVEHHLFPAVPTWHLPQLAARMDAALGDLTWKQVIGGPVPPDSLTAIDLPDAAPSR